MRLLIDGFLFSFDFVVEVSSTSFCSNPDALGFDESENGIFDSLKNIARLPQDSPKEGDQLADSAAGAVGELPIGEAGKEFPATSIGECFGVVDWFSRRTFVDVFCAFLDKQSEDRPKSPPLVADVDLILPESSR